VRSLSEDLTLDHCAVGVSHKLGREAKANYKIYRGYLQNPVNLVIGSNN